MRFLVLHRPRPSADPTHLAKAMQEHAQWLEQGLSLGLLHGAESWGAESGVAIVWAAHAAGARALVDQSPLAKSGLFEIDIDPVYDQVDPDVFGPKSVPSKSYSVPLPFAA